MPRESVKNCALIWSCSSYAHKRETKFNQSCSIITGTLNPTPRLSLYCLAEIASIRWDAFSKKMHDPRHLLNGHIPLLILENLIPSEQLPPGTNLEQKYWCTSYLSQIKQIWDILSNLWLLGLPLLFLGTLES